MRIPKIDQKRDGRGKYLKSGKGIHFDPAVVDAFKYMKWEWLP